MNEKLDHFVSGSFLPEASAEELSAISGGANYMLNDGKGTGVTFFNGGLHAMRNGVVIISINNGKATVPPA